jgi:hypothetical protein
VRVLSDLGIGLGALDEEVRALAGRGGSAFAGHIRFASAAREALELSQREASQLGHDHIGTEHLLLGLVRQGQGAAAQVLIQRGADLATVRTKVVEVLSAQQRGQASPEAITGIDTSVQLQMIGLRLAAIEAKLGIEGATAYQELRNLGQALAWNRRSREAAIDEQDSRGAVNLRYLKQAMQTRQRAVERGMFDDPPAASGL